MLAAHPFNIVYFRSSPSVVVYCILLSLQIHSLWPRLAKRKSRGHFLYNDQTSLKCDFKLDKKIYHLVISKRNWKKHESWKCRCFCVIQIFSRLRSKRFKFDNGHKITHFLLTFEWTFLDLKRAHIITAIYTVPYIFIAPSPTWKHRMGATTCSILRAQLYITGNSKKKIEVDF